MDTSSIAAKLQELQQYEIYEPIARRLGGEASNLRPDVAFRHLLLFL